MPSSNGAARTAEGERRSVILVVEDDAILALELEQILVGAGYEVVLAADGASALAHASDPALLLHAVVCNLNLPFGMSGHEVIRRLRMSQPGLPVVVVTGYSPASQQADLRGAGGPAARLQKPIDPQRLLQRLQDAMSSISGVA